LNAESAVGDSHVRLGASLASAAGELRVPVSPEQAARLIVFVELLFRWNRTYNLTAIRDLSGMLSQHVVDCLAAILPLRRELAGRAQAQLLDVGSGGGLPGVVFAVMEPETIVTCVDSVGKKTAFVRQAAAALKLDNLRVERARVEDLAGERFDVITSRAFGSLAELVHLTAGLLADGGMWMAMKGKVPGDEIAALPTDVNMFHVERLAVPGVRGERCLVWMRAASTKSRSREVPKDI